MLYRFHSYSLDLDRGCLVASGEEVELRPKSFDILRYLVENAGRLIAKEEIIGAVWPRGGASDESLARCVSDVRSALGDRDQSIIKTVPRRGYLFAAQVEREGAPRLPRTGSAIDRAWHTDKPRIAVLAFNNMSDDPSQEYFSDGFTEDIITELSRFSELAVIARNSSFQYKDKLVNVRQIGRDLDARYVLEGSVRRVEGRVRITAQLIDATTGIHRWAERYDRQLDDVLAVQDEVARTVASILAAHVSKAEDDRILSKPASSWEAHDYFMRAAAALNAFMSSFRVADLAEVRRLAERAVSLDANYARPYQILSSTYVVEWNSFDTRSMNHAALEKAYELASMAVQLDGNLPQARAQFGIALSWKRHHQAALAEFSKAVAINPNFNDWRYALALLHASAPARALEVGRAYVRLDPFAPASASVWLGAAHYMLKEYEQALPHLREAVARMPNARFAHIWLAATYAQLGQLKLAREETAQSLQLDPGYSIEGSARVIFGFRSPEDTEHLCDGLRKAGMPER